MQYLPPRNMSSIATPKIHKVVGSPTDNTPWMQPTTPSNTAMSDQYFSTTNNIMVTTDTDTDVYMSDTSKSQRSRNSTTDMCVEKNTEGKPPYSYATLIKYAIERSSENKLTLSQIYQWVIEHYPYYGSAGSGWKNSIRHNLSLNKSFVRVPRPVNEPGKGSYWTVDQFAIDTDQQRTRTNVRGRSSRSSSDPSSHNNHRTTSHNNDPWSSFGGNLAQQQQHRNYRDGRSLSTDAGAAATSVAAALRRTSQYGYCTSSHPYGAYEHRSCNNAQPQYNYPTIGYHYGQQRMPSHETLLSARQHSSVTYSLPASATTTNHFNHQSTTPFPSNSSPHSFASLTQQQQQQNFSSPHRQSCPDLTNIISAVTGGTFSETNNIPNFNTAGSTNEVVCLEPSSAFGGENRIIYTTPPSNSFNNLYSNSEHHKLFATSSSSSSSPSIKGNLRSTTTPSLSSFFKDFDGGKHQQEPTINTTPANHTPGLPSPVLSPSNCSSSASSQHLSAAAAAVAADPLAALVTQHPSSVTTKTTAASTTTKTTAATPENRLTSPSYFASASGLATIISHNIESNSPFGFSSSASVEECLTSPSSPLIITIEDRNKSPSMSSQRSPVPFCIDGTTTTTSGPAAVAYMEMVSQQQQQQQQQQQNASTTILTDDNNSLSSASSSQHDVCSPQPSLHGGDTGIDKYAQMMSNETTFLSSQQQISAAVDYNIL